MTTNTRTERHRRLLALAFAFASTCVSFASTIELLNLQSGRPAAIVDRSLENLDL